MMKKLTLVPKTDTITICLPSDWVGKVVNCILQNTAEEAEMAYPLAAEKKAPYHVIIRKRK